MANKIAMIAIVLIMTISVMSVAAMAATGNSIQSKSIGNYSFTDNTTTSTVYNLSYKTDSGSQLIANSVTTAGTNTSLSLSSGDDSSTLALQNVTLSSGSDGNVLLFSAGAYGTIGSPVAPSMSLNLSGNVSKVALTAYQSDYLSTHSSGIMASFVSNQMYEVQTNGSNFYVFSNSPSTQTNNVIVFQNSSAATPLIVGISSSEALKDKIHQEIGSHPYNRFFYNNTTGQLTGRFISLQFNTTTGAINNFTDSQLNTQVFSSITTAGNGTIGGNYPGPIFPTSQPIVVGSVFFYANNTAVYQVHDNPSMVSDFYLSNATTTLQVSAGLNVSIFKPTKTDLSGSSNPTLGTSLTNYTNVNLGDQYDVESSPTVVFIHNSTFTSSLFVNGATVTVNGNTVQIHANKTAHMTFIAPPGIQGKGITVRSALEYGINHGRIAAVIVLGQPGQTQSNLSVNYNSSVQISVQNVATNSVSLKVSGKTHEGTNIAIFVPNGVINANSSITVKFDNKSITLSSGVNGVINATSTTHASFYSEKVNGGTLIILHVPHFSTHTVQISTASGSPKAPLGNGTVLYIGLGAVAVIGILAGIALRRRNK